MNAEFSERATVLVLNRAWIAIDAITPAQAFGHLATASGRALLIADGVMRSFSWDEWRTLPVGEGDAAVGTPRGRVRVPTVIVLANYSRVPVFRPKFGFRALWERDGGRCQYSGRKLTPAEANIDHILPRSRGGRGDWKNCVISDRNVNSRKGAKTPAEAGLRLLSVPHEPRPVPATLRLRNTWNIPDWDHFLKLTA